MHNITVLRFSSSEKNMITTMEKKMGTVANRTLLSLFKTKNENDSGRHFFHQDAGYENVDKPQKMK